MNCSLKKRDETIAAYLAGTLNEEEMKIFEEHYFQCKDCFNDLQAAADALNLIRNEGPAAFTPLIIKEKKFSSVPPQKSFFGKLFGTSGYKWGIAAAAVTAIIVILIFLPENPVEIREDEKSITSSADTAVQESSAYKEDIIADLNGPSFKPNIYMEEWITERTRSVNKIIDSVYSPGIGDQFSDSAGQILFRWKTKNETAVSLKVLDNSEEEVLTVVPAKKNYPEFNVRLNSAALPQPGLYYWRIESDEEVLYTGKFYYLEKTK